MVSPYLVDDEKISLIARVLRRMKDPRRVTALWVALAGEFPLADVRGLLDAAVKTELTRRSAFNAKTIG